uniref:Uncharacterized protein n=1 Tax=Meloidogyne incognita TaxID=6306 RepID=A0A914MG82_MELIC
MLRDLVLDEICAQHLHYPAVVWTTVETHLIYVPQDSDEFLRATSDEGTHSISSHLHLISRESSFFELTNLQNQLISSSKISQKFVPHPCRRHRSKEVCRHRFRPSCRT